MADIESILWEMFDEDRGQFGASGSPTYIAEVLTEKLLSDEAVERAAEAVHHARGLDDYGAANDDERDEAESIARAALTAAIEGEQ